MSSFPSVSRGLAPFLVVGLASGPLSAQEPAGAVHLDADVVGSDQPFYPRLSLRGTTVVGESFSLAVENSGPANLGVIAWSVTQQPVYAPDLMATVWPGAPFFVEAFTVGAALDAEGLLALDPVPASLSGATVTAQAAAFSILSPSFFRVSDAQELRFGPAPRTRGTIGSAAWGLGLNGEADVVNSVAFEDVDGDGFMDVLAAPGAATVLPLLSKHRGDGDCGFESSELGGFFTAEVVRAGELTGDGEVDLVAFDRGAGSLAIWEQSNGLFLSQLPVVLSSGLALRDARVVDFDADGDQDIVSFSFAPPELFVHRNDSGGLFSSLPPVSVPFPNNPSLVDGFGFEVADLTGDGLVDYVLANGLGDLRVMQGTTAGVGGLFASLTLAGGGVETEVTAVDVDQDGMLDLAVAYGDAQVGPFTYELIPGHGAGGFGPVQTYALPRPAESIRFGDVQGDGVLDLVIATGGADLFADAYFVERLTNSFNPASFLAPRALPLGGKVIGAELRDGDGDGDLDLFAVAGTPGEVTVLQWVAGQGFAVPLDFDLAGVADSVRLTDVDSDGNLDALVRDTFAGEIYLHYGNGDRTFGPGTLLFQDLSGALWDVLDLDGDGDEDIVIAPTASTSANRVIVYRNVNGAFDKLFVFGGNSLGVPQALAAGRFVDDVPGTLDLAVASVRQTSAGPRLYVNVFENDEDDLDTATSLFFTPSSSFIDLADQTSPVGLVVVDQDGDGFDEVFATSPDLNGADAVLVDPTAQGGTSLKLVALGARAIGAAPRVDLDLDGIADEAVLIDTSTSSPTHFGAGGPGVGLTQAADSVWALDPNTATRLLVLEFGEGGYADAAALDELGRVFAAVGSGGADSVSLRDAVRAQLGGQIADLDLGDLDGDGVAELVAIHFGVERRLVVSTMGE